MSEGGFAPNRVSAASILDVAATTDKKGKEYYTYNILTRTQDGNEGGKHNLIKATVSDGKLWLLKIQIGDKRWIFGKDKEAMLVFDSFTVSAATSDILVDSCASYNLNILLTIY